ncbi:hypothetical protein [Pseudomonas asiatica]|uniref:hypothetical protein n=1 Tax=Pseudomonas asiatica TaxID=2219225 RepID=UPI0010C143DB|nr:hypothetical protein [Pseudomonas asiatica]
MKETKEYSSKTLKYRNLAWLVATLVLDILVLLVIVFHKAIEDLTPTTAIAIRVSLTALLPIPTLILSSLLSADLKAVLVFWRIKNPLPGARAFTVHAPADSRIDLATLRKNIGEFPTTERDQNAKWYSLYKLVDSDPSVVDSHKNYLLLRDIAAMSLLLALTAPMTMYFVGIDTTGVKTSAVLLFTQYLITALSARTTGIRFVQNVLAVHASHKVAGSKPQVRKKAATNPADL